MKFIRFGFRRKIIFSFGRLVKFIIFWILFLRLLISCVIRHKTNLFHAFLLIFCRRIFLFFLIFYFQSRNFERWAWRERVPHQIQEEFQTMRRSNRGICISLTRHVVSVEFSIARRSKWRWFPNERKVMDLMVNRASNCKWNALIYFAV